MNPSAALSQPRWAVYLRLGRVSNLPTVWTNALAGLLLAGAGLRPAGTVVLMLALSAFYIGGMFLNDAFDAEFDAAVRPERPIPSGYVGRGEVYGIGFALLILGEALVAVCGLVEAGAVNPAALIGGAILAALIVYYDYRHKSDPLGPLVMALCRAMIYGIAAALVLPLPALFTTALLAWGMAALICYLIGLTYVAKQENLTEIRNVWPLLFLAAPFVYRAPALLDGAMSAVLFLLLLAWVGYCLAFLIVPSRRSIPKAVTGLIAGISLLDGLLIAGAGGTVPLLAACGAGFAATLALQRWVPGT
jgi:4-hydroxybenzoate polyprenyltransferase